MNDTEHSGKAANSSVSLYADWRHRREHINDDATSPQAAKLLDFLLSRYADDAQAQQPARFPYPSEIRLNSIAMVVNHHLAKRIGVGGTRNADEADARVTQVVRRMAAPVEPEIEDPFAQETAGKPIKLHALRRAWRELLTFADAGDVRLLICEPDPESEYPSSVYRALHAAGVLTGTDHPKAVSYSLLAWRHLLAMSGRSWLTDYLETRARQPEYRKLAAEKIRSALEDTSLAVRRRAYQLLAQPLGDMQDVGLLLDLHALPDGTMCDSERKEIVAAINRLSQCVG